MDIYNIGKNIRKERKKQHLTISQLAEKADISDNFMGNIERGTDIPSLETTIKIINALLVDANTILDGEILICSHIEYTDKLNVQINQKLNSMNREQKQFILTLINSFENFCNISNKT